MLKAPHIWSVKLVGISSSIHIERALVENTTDAQIVITGANEVPMLSSSITALMNAKYNEMPLNANDLLEVATLRLCGFKTLRKVGFIVCRDRGADWRDASERNRHEWVRYVWQYRLLLDNGETMPIVAAKGGIREAFEGWFNAPTPFAETVLTSTFGTLMFQENDKHFNVWEYSL